MATGIVSMKATHRSIKVYYETLTRYAGQSVSHETAVRSAFQNLLADAAKCRHWTLVPELASEGRGRARVVPDGTVRDEFLIPRGYWEAKDTADDLDVEIAGAIHGRSVGWRFTIEYAEHRWRGRRFRPLNRETL